MRARARRCPPERIFLIDEDSAIRVPGSDAVYRGYPGLLPFLPEHFPALLGKEVDPPSAKDLPPTLPARLHRLAPLRPRPVSHSKPRCCTSAVALLWVLSAIQRRQRDWQPPKEQNWDTAQTLLLQSSKHTGRTHTFLAQGMCKLVRWLVQFVCFVRVCARATS